MKKIAQIIAAAAVVLLVASCAHTYSTRAAGQANASYVSVLTAGPQYKDVKVVVDGEATSYGKVYTVKLRRKTAPVVITPGKHKLQVVADGNVVIDEVIFLGVQETKEVILR
ncbi:hypothetical protein FACS1894159_11030 [Bacteroidia bacterium]|nr:hypothetical protein FACS1894159_11030 [Bacteroidia bacterium]